MTVEMKPGEPWGKCFVASCPLFGSLGRGDEWACFCHFACDAKDFNEITNMLLRERAIGESAVQIRMFYGTDAWAEIYRAIQKRLIDAERKDMLFNADGKDTPPVEIVDRKMPPVVKMWLARLEAELSHMADEIAQKNRTPVQRTLRTVPTAPIIGPTHAMQHYTEPQQ
jgi:hypothetical protein